MAPESAESLGTNDSGRYGVIGTANMAGKPPGGRCGGVMHGATEAIPLDRLSCRELYTHILCDGQGFRPVARAEFAEQARLRVLHGLGGDAEGARGLADR